jgi:lipopolysaccharide export system protein LptA
MKIWRSKPAWRPFTGAMVLASAVLMISFSLATGVRGDAPAPTSEPSEPIHINADRLISDSRQNHAEFIGHVKVVQDQTTITSDRLKLIYKEGQIEQSSINTSKIDIIEAYGNVRIDFDNRVAVGQKAVYTTSDRKVVLTGPGAKVISGTDVAEGESITYYRDSGKVEIVGQVNMIIRSDQRGLN